METFCWKIEIDGIGIGSRSEISDTTSLGKFHRAQNARPKTPYFRRLFWVVRVWTLQYIARIMLQKTSKNNSELLVPESFWKVSDLHSPTFQEFRVCTSIRIFRFTQQEKNETLVLWGFSVFRGEAEEHLNLRYLWNPPTTRKLVFSRVAR